MREDFARAERRFDDPQAGDYSTSYTVKELIEALFDPSNNATIVGGTYSHCQSFTVVWDSEDALVNNTLTSPDVGWMFAIKSGDIRFDKIMELFNYTRCVFRFENDGYVHIFYPRIEGDDWKASTEYHVGDFVIPTSPNDYTYECTTPGTSGSGEPSWGTTPDGTTNDNTVVWTCRDYHYEYSLSGSNHPFYSKVNRDRLVLPNRILVQNFHRLDTYDEGGNYHSGFAGLKTDGTITNDINDADLFDVKIHWRYYLLPVTSDAQAEQNATVILKNFILNSQTGAAEVPMNVAQELYDYVKITDSRLSNYLIGNIQYIEREYNAFVGNAREGAYKMTISFGSNYSSVGSLSPSTVDENSPWTEDILALWNALNSLGLQVTENFEAQQNQFTSKWISSLQRIQIPHGADEDKETYPRYGAMYIAGYPATTENAKLYICPQDGVWVQIGGSVLFIEKNLFLAELSEVIPTISMITNTPGSGDGGSPTLPLSTILPSLQMTASDPTGTGSGSPSDPEPTLSAIVPSITLYAPILYETYTTGKDSDSTIYGDNWEAQIFQPQSNHNLFAIWLYLKRSTAGVGTVNVSLYSTTGTPSLPNAQLKTAQFNANTWLTTSYQWKMVILSAQAVTALTDYAIVIEVPDGDETNYVSWGYDGTSPSYANGYRAYSDDDASSWNQDTASDFLFEEGG
jgi:hypothetical protein